MGKKIIGYAGTYTRKTSEGIYSFVLDTEAGKLENVQVAAKIGSPTYLAISDDKKHLYAVSQQDSLGGVAAYSIQAETGDLTFLNDKHTEGAPPCHLEVVKTGVVTGNYHKGTIEHYTIDGKGQLIDSTSVIQHEGNGPHDRQEKPHVHFTGSTPDGKFIIVADLGTDELVTYEVVEGSLEKRHTFKTKPGTGPRHIRFHPNGNYAYLLTELSTEVIVLAYHQDGSFTEIQSIRAIPEDYTATNDASAIHITADGSFVYTGNRGHDSITTFAVDKTTGELTLIEHTPSGGAWPRDFVLDPSEQFLIASNQESGTLVLFSRNIETGKLTQLDSIVEVPEVVCVKFL